MYMDTRKTKRATQESTEMETFVPESSIKVFSSMESTKNWNAYHLFRFTWFVWVKKRHFQLKVLSAVEPCSYGYRWTKTNQPYYRGRVKIHDQRAVEENISYSHFLNNCFSLVNNWYVKLLRKQLTLHSTHKTFLKSVSKPPQMRLSVLVS